MLKTISRQSGIILTVLILMVVASAGFLVWDNFAHQIQPVGCTQEAKLCPDGTAVGRVGPSCEFASCPPAVTPLEITIFCTNKNCEAQQIFAGAGSLVRGCFRNLSECKTAASVCDPTTNCGATTSAAQLKTFVDQKQKLEFKYQEKLATTYISGESWPPTVKVTNGKYSCQASTTNNSLALPQIAERVIAGQTYCVKELIEGAAGSTYTTYDYITTKVNKLVDVNFVLRAPQCLNYDNPKQAECLKESRAFRSDDLVSPVIASLKFTK